MIHELKRYEATPGNANALRQRFADITMPIFRRLGVDVLQCWDAADGSDAFYYLVSFASEDERRDAWKAFGDDTEWKSAKAASETSGPLLAHQSTTLLTPTEFSPGRP